MSTGTVYLKPRSPIENLTQLEFMYTPQIEYGHDVKYDAYSLTHTNYQPYAFSRSENPSIGLSCKFSAHTLEHFGHSVYALRFLRTYTKMNYGRQDPMRGQPPRILRFFAYGEQIFNDVPVVISKFSVTFPEDIDYVGGTVIIAGKPGTPDIIEGLTLEEHLAGPGQQGVEHMQTVIPGRAAVPDSPQKIYLPMIFTVNISLLVQYNLSRVVQEFNLNDFAAGKLTGKGYI
jgi:hypothetical protein